MHLARNSLNTITVLALLTFTLHSKSSDWKLSVNKKGIVVHKREVANSDLLEFRVRTQIKAPLLHILSVLQDLKSFKDWDPFYRDLKILEKISDNEYVYYYAVKTPWPLKDRDFVAKSIITIDKKNHWLHMNDRNITHPKAPVRSDRIRMPYLRIHWSFKPKHNGQETWIELKVHSDPGGWLPDWVKNMAGSDSAYDMIYNLRKRVTNGKIDLKFVKKYKEFENWH